VHSDYEQSLTRPAHRMAPSQSGSNRASVVSGRLIIRL